MIDFCVKMKRVYKISSKCSWFLGCKEAASKAIGVGIGEICSFYDIKIKKDKNNAPKIKYSKKLKKKI